MGSETAGARYSRNALAEEIGNTPVKRENHRAAVALAMTLDQSTVIDFRLGLARFLAHSGNSISEGMRGGTGAMNDGAIRLIIIEKNCPYQTP